MMRLISKFVCFLVVMFFMSSCKENPPATDEMKDAAGNKYKTVTIGNQEWMAENLSALFTNYTNNIGSNNPNAIVAGFWYPDNDERTIQTHGLLYSFNAARELIPRGGGWRIPTLLDLNKLLQVLGVDYENGANALANALNINVYPGSNADDMVSINKYFSLVIDGLPTAIEFDHITVRIHAADFPDSDPPIFRNIIYFYNVTRHVAGSVRFVRDIY